MLVCNFKIYSLILIFVSLIFFPYFVEANGSVRTYKTQTTELYEIGLGTVPDTPTRGVIHFAAYVKNLDNDISYDDATVYIKAYESNSDNPQVGPLKMLNTVMDPTYYEADFPIETKGIWQIELDVMTSDGEAKGFYEIEVHDSNPIIPILTLLFLIGLLVILGFSVRTWIKQSREKRLNRCN
tara:strand:- start:644 stop:1192 length:549 start_codon:yes stop_codon:yes gene_type:complete